MICVEEETKTVESNKDWITSGGGEWFEFGKKGNSIEGVIVDKRTIPGKFGEQSVIDVEIKPGNIVPVGCTTVLANKLKVVPIGSLIRVMYLGLKKSKSGIEYKDFEVLYKLSAHQ